MTYLNDRDHDRLDEIVARTRRIETRLTKHLIDIGSHSKNNHNDPVWVPVGDAGYITLVALDVPMSLCLHTIPEGHEGEVNVVHDGRIVAVLNV